MARLGRLFWELFRIALCVVGGGYAILAVADDVFGRRLKWLREGELVDHLSVFQMVPGLIAGNTAVYVGLKTAGRTGAAVGLAAVALPSLAIFLAVSYGYQLLPVDNPWVAGALAGLRAALTGVLLGTIARNWRKTVRGVRGYATVSVASALLIGFGWNPACVLLLAMAGGIAWQCLGGAAAAPADDGASLGVALAPLSRGQRLAGGAALLAALGAFTYLSGALFWTFVGFGLLCFGGGYVLVPLYEHVFVGPSAPLLQLPAEQFSNVMALTQATPGPISINAATFFGFRLGGVGGAVVATCALLLPSFVLLTLVLTGLERWKRSVFVQGLLGGVRPAANALLLAALVCFARMSVWTPHPAGFAFHPLALALALFTGWTFYARKMSVLRALFLCAVFGTLAARFQIA